MQVLTVLPKRVSQLEIFWTNNNNEGFPRKRVSMFTRVNNQKHPFSRKPFIIIIYILTCTYYLIMEFVIII